MTNFREYTTESGLKILAGKNASSNDKLIQEATPKDIILHTSAPGSPFVNTGESPSKKDINEAIIFCAKYSQDWRDSKRDIIVNKFIRNDMDKSPKMKAGTWSVKKQEKLKVKKADILKFEEELKNETN
jgi:predicted ribosome quality control (RQC) complex YloA/Tae2 family protein